MNDSFKKKTINVSALRILRSAFIGKKLLVYSSKYLRRPFEGTIYDKLPEIWIIANVLESNSVHGFQDYGHDYILAFDNGKHLCFELNFRFEFLE